MSAVLVLGAGVGDPAGAAKTRRRPGRERRVVPFDRRRVHPFRPSYLWVLAGRRDPIRSPRDPSRSAGGIRR